MHGKSPPLYAVLCICGTPMNASLMAIKPYSYKWKVEYQKFYLLWLVRKCNLIFKKAVEFQSQYFLLCMCPGSELHDLRYKFSVVHLIWELLGINCWPLAFCPCYLFISYQILAKNQQLLITYIHTYIHIYMYVLVQYSPDMN